jgi:hypothetical protein
MMSEVKNGQVRRSCKRKEVPAIGGKKRRKKMFFFSLHKVKERKSISSP